MERDLKCMYCAEMGITNTNVFIEIVDVELGAGWICKECFIESEKEKDEHLKELEQKLKAKEQECEELKRQRQADKGLITSTGKMNYQLIQEYDKLKTENDELKETFDGLFKVQYKLADNNKKLRQCLTEIKEIIHFNKTNRLSGGADISIAQILQKISEVEDE